MKDKHTKNVIIWYGFKEEEMLFMKYLPFLIELLN